MSNAQGQRLRLGQEKRNRLRSFLGRSRFQSERCQNFHPHNNCDYIRMDVTIQTARDMLCSSVGLLKGSNSWVVGTGCVV